MTRTERIQWQLFVLLLVALAGSVFYFSRGSKEPLVQVKGRKTPNIKINSSAEVLPQISALQNKLPEFEGVQRNIFEFGDNVPEVDPPVEEQAILIPQTIPIIPVGPDVTYLGFYREREGSERKLAAISNGGQIYVGGVGAILGGKYRVLQVEDEFIEVEYLPENRVIRLEIGRNGNPPNPE